MKWDIYSRVETRVRDINKSLYAHSIKREAQVRTEQLTDNSDQSIEHRIEGYMERAKTFISEYFRDE